MSKEAILKIVAISVTLVLISIVFNKCSRSIVDNMIDEMETTSAEESTEKSFEYSLEEQPIKYNVYTEKGRKEYYKFIDKYIQPIKLKKFINFDRIYLDEPYLYGNGQDVIDYIKFEGYTNLFKNMFDIERTNFEDCPVTIKFVEKFNMNLSKIFGINYDEVWVNTSTLKQTIKVEARSGISLDGEAEYSMLYRFKYTLDEEGNVDDVILEHVGWD